MKKLSTKAPILLLAIFLTVLGFTLTPNVVSADPPWIIPTVYSSSINSLINVP